MDIQHVLTLSLKKWVIITSRNLCVYYGDIYGEQLNEMLPVMNSDVRLLCFSEMEEQ